MSRVFALLAFSFLSLPGWAQTAAAKMRASVEQVLAALPEKSRAQATKPFEDRDRVD